MRIEHLNNLIKKKGLIETKKILRETLYIGEKIDGISFSFMLDNHKINFYKKNLNKPISYTDRVIIKLYEPAIKHIKRILKNNNSIPKFFIFGFEYLPFNEPVNIAYNRIPKNNLILTNIISNYLDKTSIDLKKWADLLQTDYLKFFNTDNNEKVYKLNDEIIDEILRIKDEDNIYDKFYDIFDKKYPIQNLYSVKGVKSEGFVFHTSDNEYPFIKLITKEYYDQNIKNRSLEIKDRKNPDLVNISILDFINYYEDKNFDDIVLKSKAPDEKYVELISKLFYNFITDEHNFNKWNEVVFEKPNFAKTNFFDLNIDLIPYSVLRNFLNSKDFLKDYLKIIISFFRKNINIKGDSLLFNKVDIIKSFSEKLKNALSIKNISNINSNSDDKIFYTKSVIPQRLKNKDKITRIDDLEIFKNIARDFYEIEDLEINDLNKQKSFDYKGYDDINIFVGKFQPFHLGHHKVLIKSYKETNLPTALVVVTNDNSLIDKNSYEEIFKNIQDDIFKKIVKDIIYVKRAWINDILDQLKTKKLKPVNWFYGEDREKNYKNQIKNFAPFIKGNLITRYDDNINSSYIRNNLDDLDKIRNLVHPAILKKLETLKQR